MKTIAKFTGMELGEDIDMYHMKEPIGMCEKCCPMLCLRGEEFEDLPQYGEITFRFCKKAERSNYSDEGGKEDVSVDLKLERIVSVKADDSKPDKTSGESLDELKDEMTGKMEDYD